MFGSADDSKPIARRFPRRPVRAGKDATGGPGVASFARAYRVPIMIAVLVATVVTTAAVTSALVSRGPPKRPGIDAATLAGTCSAAADKARQDLAGLVVAALLPAYLRRTLEAVLARLPATDRPHIVVSQDGHLPEVTAVVGDMQKQFHAAAPDIAFSHIHHTQSAESGDDGFGYMKLSRHFGWALGNVFDRGHPRVIVLEDDLEIAADFFEYFSAVAPVLDADSTLLAASAYNDIGQPAFVADSARVYRSDFFPGLGWMLTRRAWAELGPKWPRGFWDDWLREPAQRKGRAFLRPEVSRTRTFGERGVSQSQFFHQYLSNIKLNAEPVAWGSVDLQYLLKPTYDRALDAAVAAAQAVPASSVVAKDCSALPRPPATGSHPLSVATRAGSLGAAFKVDYGSVGAYPRAAGAFGFIADVKAGVPRTAYRGVVSLQHKGCFVYLVPAGGAPLPER
ncbi:hypothetical protein FNF29_03837 [Cafeteria roenbergensis]|uniref:alpha-1,3-mannosyl-glycoprotein 2-beta-N-acetylglucosaminyltransferase n=1 Tax=Cafeteria roenbergensis TaxID=33653 RepID=A0A5A8CKM8_CAFRO|nr:hypothetical protein FNF29_03837 [Cafeteria roenbergensis]|eukprot:KAA0152610.1 hypothetical protein FNF29_03837 [Cafeteria roenbergensis]